MPAVPPCLTEKSVLSAECRHTPCPSRRHHVLATWQIPFTSPSEAHLLKLHLSGSHRPGLSGKPYLSFTSSSSVYSYLFGMVIYYHLSFVLSTIFKKLFCVFSQIVYLKLFSYMSTKPVTKSACLLASSLPPVTCQP